MGEKCAEGMGWNRHPLVVPILCTAPNQPQPSKEGSFQQQCPTLQGQTSPDTW